MDQTPVIFDISSDDEPTWNDPKEDDYSWLSRVLESVNKEIDDPDEVVVVGEVNVPKHNKSKSSKVTVKDYDAVDDDDCVVLEGDPDKAVSVVNDTTEESDELLIVGQKGQIACRDYPHPRHLCAKLPFRSTPHEKYCDQCHCFVCDSVAPCAYWSCSFSGLDHCHANDKELKWKNLRKDSRLCKDSTLPILKDPVTSLSGVPLQYNQASARDIIRLKHNPAQQNQISRPSTIRACSIATRGGMTDITSQSRNRYSGSNLYKKRPEPHMVSPEFVGVRNNVIRKDRRHITGNLSSRMGSTHTLSRGPGVFGGASISNVSGYTISKQSNVGYTSQHAQVTAQLAKSNNKGPSELLDVSYGTFLESCLPPIPCQPTLVSAFLTPMPSECQVLSQPIPASNVNQNMNQFNGSQNQTTIAQDFADFGFGMGSNSSQIYQQLPVDNFPLQNTGVTNDPIFDFEDWLLDNHSVPLVSDNPISEPTTFDSDNGDMNLWIN